MVTLLAFAGLAIDVGMMQWRSLLAQHAADAAAQEAMYQYFRGDTNWSSEGQAQASMNGFSNGVNGATVSLLYPPTSGPLNGDALSVQAKVTQTFNTLFMGLLKSGGSSVTATATAREIPTCIWIMNPSNASNSALQLASTGMYPYPNCGVYVNTASGNSLQVDYFSSLYSLRNRVVGAASTGASSSGNIGPQVKYGAAVKNDPLAYVTAPTLTTCTYTGVSYSSGSHTLTPGSYCGGITLSSTTITLNPGLYLIDGGMSVSNSNIYGTGVTLYFTKKSGGSYTVSNFNSSNSSTYGIYLSAPTSSSGGAIPGVVVFADRNWVTHGSQGLKFVGYTITGDGFWYMLNTGLYLWQCPFTYSSNYNGLVLDNIYQYSGGSHFASNYSALGGSPLHYEDGVLEQ